MRALFHYNPAEDSLIPCPELGLEFKSGDILQVIVDFESWHRRNSKMKSHDECFVTDLGPIRSHLVASQKGR